MQLMKTKIIYGCEARGDAHNPYLTRITLIEFASWQVCIHIFHRSDYDDLHDHPWWFVSWVLWRGYNEVTPKGRRRKWPGMILFRPKEWIHRVELLDHKPAVTLVVMGNRAREWGFYTSKGWKLWTDYFKEMGC